MKLKNLKGLEKIRVVLDLGICKTNLSCFCMCDEAFLEYKVTNVELVDNELVVTIREDFESGCFYMVEWFDNERNNIGHECFDTIEEALGYYKANVDKYPQWGVAKWLNEAIYYYIYD